MTTHAAPVGARPRVGVVKFASCDGCQLTLLDLEDELLSIVEHFEIVDFPEATSSRSPGPYDVLFV
jgi:coenzyme F420-reducing hydrogenase gamma subunit